MALNTVDPFSAITQITMTRVIRFVTDLVTVEMRMSRIWNVGGSQEWKPLASGWIWDWR